MTLERSLMLAGVGVLAVAGAGTAIAATTGGRGGVTAVRAGGIPADAGFGLAGPRLEGLRRFRPLRAGGLPGRGDDLAVAASYLGTTVADLAQIQSGKTLAQVANATSGKSAAGLVAALVAHDKQELAAAVSAGRLTQAQADSISAGLQQRITNLVNGVHPAGPRGGWSGSHRI